MFWEKLKYKYPKYEKIINFLEILYNIFFYFFFIFLVYFFFVLMLDMHIFIFYITEYLIKFDKILRLHVFLYSNIRAYWHRSIVCLSKSMEVNYAYWSKIFDKVFVGLWKLICAIISRWWNKWNK